MNQNYTQVPSIITGKDLDYLSDMFNWNYEAYKKSVDSTNYIENENIKSIVNKASKMFHDNMTNVLNILAGGSNE